MICSICGEHNPERARFCLACAAPLEPRADARSSRKTVTILFCDVANSTALADRCDPETLRGVMSRYFAETSAVVARYGGTVEKYIGDAVMAVFGIPHVHEDDATRAVLAASKIIEAIAALNGELRRDWGAELTVRIGVNTGEVVAGDASARQAFAAGKAVNLAQRLEAAAGPGEIVIGDATAGLAENAVVVEALPPLRLKGTSEPVRAWRVRHVVEGAPAFARRLDSRFVGRLAELRHLEAVFERVERERTCCACTILGAPGSGKSRLAAELIRRVGSRARPLSGRCLAYGDGITFWPLAELVRTAGGADALAGALAGQADAAAVAARITRAVGSSPMPLDREEIFWAVRRLFEGLAGSAPLIVSLEDVHWAEPTFLDLIEYLVGWTRDAPILLLCLARPELLDERPDWLHGQANTSALTLERLPEADAERLLDALTSEAPLSAAIRSRITDLAEGNPLYLEQIAALAAEGGMVLGELQIPATIQSLLTARLDRLEASERAVIERASVIGKEFWQRAVVDLSPEAERADVGTVLLRLVRKDLLRPGTADVLRGDGFRFHHLLIRDAAYAAVSKEVRADLHERFADWLELNAADRIAELEEIVGHHFEQAYRFRTELRTRDPKAADLATRAADRLGRSGRRAHNRGDLPAAVSLLTRAGALLAEESGERARLLADLGEALRETGDLQEADRTLAEATELARGLGDRAVEWRARLVSTRVRHQLGSLAASDLERVARRARIELDDLGDARGLAAAWWTLAWSAWLRCRATEAEACLEHAIEDVRRAGARRLEAQCMNLLFGAGLFGPLPVRQAIRRCREVLERRVDQPRIEASACRALAVLTAMLGEFEEARSFVERDRSILHDLGLRFQSAAAAEGYGMVELLAGDGDAAERELRHGYETLERMGEAPSLANVAALLAQALYGNARYDEADAFSAISERAAARDDLSAQIQWRAPRAKVLARRGRREQAMQLAREAVVLAAKTDFLNQHGDALLDLAEVHRLTGGATEAATAAAAAVRLYEAKGNLVAATRGRVLVRALGRGSDEAQRGSVRRVS